MMYVGSVDVGRRIGLGVEDAEQARFSMGVSMAGDVKADDYTAPYTDIVLTFPLMREATKNTLKAYLNDVIHQGGIVNLIPDAADDLQIQRNIPTPFIFNNMRAVRISHDTFRAELFVRFIGTNLGAMFAISDDFTVKIV